MEHVPLKCNFERSQNHIKQVAEQLQSDPEGNIPIGLWVDGVAVACDKKVSLEFQSASLGIKPYRQAAAATSRELFELEGIIG